jgi:alkylated DNA repair dioxygenase AlkB
MEMHIVSEKGATDSIFIYIPEFVTIREEELIMCWLGRITDFKVNMNYDKTKIIRLQKWYQMEGEYFCPKWKKRYDRWMSHKYSDILLNLQNKIQVFLNDNKKLKNYQITIPSINSCLINMYRLKSDRIRAHRDTEESFGKEPTIVGLSIGAPRDICFKRVEYDNIGGHLSKIDRKNQNLNFNKRLESRSLFIMCGSSQKKWTHEVPPGEEEGIRFNLTFREFIRVK